MYFNNMMFNPQYVNPNYYQQQARIMQHNYEQDCEVLKATNAMRDLCRAVNKMDDAHQREAFWKCLAVMAEESGWNVPR